MKDLFKVALLLLAGIGASAQTLENVNLLNTTGLYGSPRFVAMGGAFTALGNDLSGITLNPAAGSVYRKDNFGLSMGFQNQNNQTSFLGVNQDRQTLDVVFQNIGLVKKFGRGDKFFFSATYNRLAEFNTSYNVSGVNAYNFANNVESGFTLGEYWLAAANGLTVFDLEQAGFFEEASAASVDILLRDENDNDRIIAFDFVDDAANVVYNYTENGSRNEFALNFGGALSKTFSWGAGIGVPSLNYTQTGTLSESGYADSSFFSAVDLVRSNSVDAIGINLKLGFIFRPVQWLRVGGSYQSPSWYRVNEIYTINTTGFARNGGQFAGTEYIFDNVRYGVTTPSIYRFGLATVLGKTLILSGDLEYTDPSGTTINARDNNNYEGDETIYQNSTESTLTLRLGSELRFGPFYVRGGFQNRASNFVDPDAFQSDVKSYTGGLGFKKGRFGFDLAYIHSQYSQTYLVHPYLAYEVQNGAGVEGANLDRATVQNDISKGSFLLGFNLSF